MESVIRRGAVIGGMSNQRLNVLGYKRPRIIIEMTSEALQGKRDNAGNVRQIVLGGVEDEVIFL